MTITSFLSPDRKLLWFFVALIIKGLFFFSVVSQPHYTNVLGTWGIYGGDSDTYIVPIDNWIKSGKYTPDYRIPGYGIFYLAFRIFFNKIAACNALIVTQYLFDCLATYIGALLALKLFKSKPAFYFTYFILVVSYYVSIFNTILSTDSVTTSLVIFWLYSLYCYFEKQQIKYLLLSGFLITWIIFLRPVYAPLFFLAVGLWAWKYWRGQETWRLIGKQILLFSLPLLLSESVWIYHNYQEHKQLIFFKKGGQWYPFQYKNSFPELVTFIQSWGGDYVFWQPNSEIGWFGLQDYRPIEAEPYRLKKPDDSVIIPDDIYTSTFNQDSLLKIREFMPIAWDDKTLDSLTYKKYNDSMRAKLNSYTTSIKVEKPFLYYFKAPVRILWKFIDFKTFKYVYLPFDTTKPETFTGRKQKIMYLTKIGVIYGYGILYYTILFMGLLGVLILILNLQKFYSFSSLVALVAVYGIAVFPFVFRSAEARYWVVTYPCLVICASYCFHLVLSKISKS